MTKHTTKKILHQGLVCLKFVLLLVAHQLEECASIRSPLIRMHDEMTYHLHPILCTSDAVSYCLHPSHPFLSTWGVVMLE